MNMNRHVVDCSTGTTSVVPLTPEQLAAAEAQRVAAEQAAASQAVLDANATTLRSRAQRALNTNATFLALASPTNAQTLAQVRNLTRETSALIRLLLHQVDDITGT